VTRYDQVIPPGSEGKIYASLDIGHLKGPVQKSIFVKTNDPKRPNLTVVMKATVKSLVDIQPQEQIAIVVQKGSQASQDLFLVADPSVKLLQPVVESNLITAKLTPPEKNGKQRLTVNVKDSSIIGTHATEIKIPVQGPISEITVPVVINIRGPLEVTPRIVSFMLKGHPSEVVVQKASDVRQAPGVSAVVVEKVQAGRKLQVLNESEGWYQVITSEKPAKSNSLPEQSIGWIQTAAVKASKPPGSPEPQEVSIKITKGKAFRLLGVESTLSLVQVQSKAGAPGSGTHQIVVTLGKVDRNKKGPTRGEILVKTDHPDQPQVRIPVFVNVM
jgi:hypothetical protein